MVEPFTGYNIPISEYCSCGREARLSGLVVMKTIEVFDPAMCCSTGVCGPTPEKDLVVFAGVLEMLKKEGVEVRRFNLAQEPMAFVGNAEVKSILDKDGEEGLPLVFVDGTLRFCGKYPSEAELSGESAAEPAAKEPMTFVKVDGPSVNLSTCCEGGTSGC